MKKKVKVVEKSKKSVIVDAPEFYTPKGKKSVNSMRAMMDGDSSIAKKLMKKGK